MTRYEANKKILEILSKYIENNPEQRFIQILWNLELINICNSELIEDRYNEESEITLSNLRTLHFWPFVFKIKSKDWFTFKYTVLIA